MTLNLSKSSDLEQLLAFKGLKLRKTRSSTTTEIVRVVPHKPYISENWTLWATFLSLTVWDYIFGEIDAVGSESCRIVIV